MRYQHHFEFDCEGEPPQIEIWDTEMKTNVMELFFEPVRSEDHGDEWADEDDWSLPKEAQEVMDKLNAELP